jgi:NitT/TauT family transport system permease protein
VLVASQALPKIALAPILVVWFGVGLVQPALMAFLLSFFPIAIETMAGLRSLDPELEYVSRSMGLRRWRKFVKVALPNSLPHIFSGLKVGITLAAVGAVVGEWVGSDNGLGTIMLRSIYLLDTPMLFAALFCLSAVAIVLFVLVGLVERLAIPWHVSQRAQSS